MTFEEIEKLIEKAQKPLEHSFLHDWLEDFQLINKEGLQPYHRFLYYLVQKMKPTFSLEIGVFRGVASAHMYYGGTNVVGIDIKPLFIDFPRNDTFTYQFINRDATVTDPVLYSALHGSVGIVFQDSSHHYEASEKEWQSYFPLLAKGAVWICDDVTEAFHDPKIDPPGKGMVQYFEDLPGDKRAYDNLHIGNKIGIILCK